MALHLTPAQEQRLERLAAQSNRTPDELAQQALDGYLKRIESLSAAVHEGEESAEREGWVPNEEVFKRLNQRLHKSA